MTGNLIKQNLKEKIYFIRGKKVIIDNDLAKLYEIPTKRLNESVKRNKERFPKDFMFQLTENEKEELVAICDRFKILKHSSSLPFVFTEQGVAMLSGVLNSNKAIKVNIEIMRVFISMRKFIKKNSDLFSKVDSLEKKQIETEKKIILIIDNKEIYFIGASIKDLGKKWFAFSKMNKILITPMLKKCNNSL